MKYLFLFIKIIAILLAVLLVAAFIFAHNVRFYPTEKNLQKQFTKNGYPAPSLQKIVTQEKHTITIVDNEKPSNQVLVFLHGSPGSSQDFRLYFQDSLLNDFRIIGINRIGYAAEGYGKTEVDLQKQAEAYVEVIKKVTTPEDKITWVGHSYGGAPAIACAFNFPKQTEALVLAAAPISPENEHIFWYSKLANNPLVYWLLPKTLQMATDEKMTHAEQLEKIAPLLSQITCRVAILQGDKDFLSPMENVDYAEKMFIKTDSLMTKRIAGQSHFFPFEGREHLVDAILTVSNSN